MQSRPMGSPSTSLRARRSYLGELKLRFLRGFAPGNDKLSTTAVRELASLNQFGSLSSIAVPNCSAFICDRMRVAIRQ